MAWCSQNTGSLPNPTQMALSKPTWSSSAVDRSVRRTGVELHLVTVQEHRRAAYLWHDLGLRERFDGLHHSAAVGLANHLHARGSLADAAGVLRTALQKNPQSVILMIIVIALTVVQFRFVERKVQYH